MRTTKLFTGFFVVTLLSLFTAGVMSAATPLSVSGQARLCMHQMNPCHFAECQDWCDINYGYKLLCCLSGTRRQLLQLLPVGPAIPAP